MTETEYDRIRELYRKWYQLAEIPGNEHADGLRGCADDLKAVLESFDEPVPDPIPESFPGDSCSTCGALAGEPCLRKCVYAARVTRGWRELRR